MGMDGEPGTAADKKKKGNNSFLRQLEGTRNKKATAQQKMRTDWLEEEGVLGNIVRMIHSMGLFRNNEKAHF